jgi:hypothetical protein
MKTAKDVRALLHKGLFRKEEASVHCLEHWW